MSGYWISVGVNAAGWISLIAYALYLRSRVRDLQEKLDDARGELYVWQGLDH